LEKGEEENGNEKSDTGAGGATARITLCTAARGGTWSGVGADRGVSYGTPAFPILTRIDGCLRKGNKEDATRTLQKEEKRKQKSLTRAVGSIAFVTLIAGTAVRPRSLVGASGTLRRAV